MKITLFERIDAVRKQIRIPRISMVLFVVILLKTFPATAQSYPEINNKTYSYYLQNNWHKLIDYYQDTVRKTPINTYYIQMRVAIAYFETRDYFNAIHHLRKARKFSETPELKRLLYFSYLYTNQKTLARNVYWDLKVKNKKDLSDLSPQLFDVIDLSVGFFSSDGFEQIKKNRLINMEETSIDKYTGNYIYFSLGMNHDFSDAFSINHSLSVFQIEKAYDIHTPDLDTTIYQTLKQTDYYINPRLTLNNGMIFSMAYRNLGIQFTDYYLDQPEDDYYLYFANLQLNDYLLYASAGKYIRNLFVKLGIAYSNINAFNNTQVDISAWWYPLGNPDIIMGFTLSDYHQRNPDENTEELNNFIFKPEIWLKALPKLYVQADYTFGELNHYQENEGAIVYNNPDAILTKAGAMLRYYFSAHLSFYLRYNYTFREDQGLIYDTEPNEQENTFNYTLQYFIGGLSWDI
jgi:hypothetical protein